MKVFLVLYTVLLFFLLTPGILVTLPSKKNKTLIALTHAILFGIIYHFTHKLVSSIEGLEGKDKLLGKDPSANTMGGIADM
jgi:hypothetical protein